MNCCETEARRVAGPEKQAEESEQNRGADRCPDCGKPVRKLSRITLKAMLRSESLKRLFPNPYRFCSTHGCPTVYIAEGSTFAIADLRVPVWQKTQDPAIPVCYCLEYSEASIQTTMEDDGGSDIIEEIRELVRDGRCACEVRNPQGSCCLGNVARVAERLRSDGAAKEVRHER